MITKQQAIKLNRGDTVTSTIHHGKEFVVDSRVKTSKSVEIFDDGDFYFVVYEKGNPHRRLVVFSGAKEYWFIKDVKPTVNRSVILLDRIERG